MNSGAPIVAGIDVGGESKGFHAVALANGMYLAKLSSVHAGEVADWCKNIGASAVGVDCPINWSTTGRPRPAEDELRALRISCFSTPAQSVADRHPTNYYGWMRNGAKLYEALDKYFIRFRGERDPRGPVSFETFPHAVACALAGEIVRARNKGAIRRALLQKAGIACDALANIDLVDAALCALTAHGLLQGRFIAHGEAEQGYIVTPSHRVHPLREPSLVDPS